MKILNTFLPALALLCSIELRAQNAWVKVGDTCFTPTGIGEFDHLRVNHASVPYLFYSDFGSDQAVVMKFNDSAWVTVGNPDFSTGAAIYPGLAFDALDTPYLVYNDQSCGNCAIVQKFDGTNWVTVGQLTNGNSAYTCIGIDHNNVIYVAFSDPNNGSAATVMKYTDDNWQLVGTAGFSGGQADYLALAIDNNNVPYLAYYDYAAGDKANVKKFDGTNWVQVGQANFSTGKAYNSLTSTIAVNDQGIVFVSYTQLASTDSGGGNQSDQQIVMKFDGSDWSLLGDVSFPSAFDNWNAIALGADGNPYLIYNHFDGPNDQMVVWKFDGANWNSPTVRQPTADNVIGCDIATNDQGEPYIAFGVNVASDKITVMRLENPLSIEVTENDQRVQVYPNPVSSQGKFQLSVTADLVGAGAGLFDAQGRLVFTFKISAQLSDFSFQGSAGLYFLKINANDGVVVKKVARL